MNKQYPSRFEMNLKGHAREGRVMTSRKGIVKPVNALRKNVSLTKTLMQGTANNDAAGLRRICRRDLISKKK